MSRLFKQVCVIGVGLIGGSLARALKKADSVDKIVGCGRDEAQLKKAVELGVIDQYESDATLAVKDADCVVLAVPLGVMQQVFESIKEAVSKDAVITDVGSAKLSVINDAQATWPDLPAGFVPGHPIAGIEKSGVEASFAELFENRCVILTPVPSSAEWAVKKTTALWQATGAEVVTMDALHHDEVLAATSHLPHVLAYVLVDTLSRMQEHREIFRFAAGGFRDFTRIASSDPSMWRDICLANHKGILSVLEKFEMQLHRVTEAVRNQDGETIEKVFMDAKNARDTHIIG